MERLDGDLGNGLDDPSEGPTRITGPPPTSNPAPTSVPGPASSPPASGPAGSSPGARARRLGQGTKSEPPTGSSLSQITEGGQHISSALALTGSHSPLETLRAEEIGRTRAFCRIAILMAFGVMLSTPFIGGDPDAKVALLIGLGAIIIANGQLALALHSEAFGPQAGYTPGRIAVAGVGSVLGVYAALYFYGPFSPAPVIIPFGLYFYSQAQSLRATLFVFVACSVGYLILAVATMSGLILDRGVVDASDISVFDRTTMLLVIEAIFLATYALGRATRMASLRAVEHHDRAVRHLAQREALLREAREELEQALAAGGIGRYTDMVLGSFELGKVIGRGGMGEVYEAQHTETRAEAAVKVLQRHMLRDTENVRRFLREARIVERIDVPNVVRVLEIGDLDAVTPYIAMERLRGTDLSERLRRQRQLSPRRAARMAREVAQGLEAARVAGVVHRDLKPRNLFWAMGRSGRRTWKILDFGISKLVNTQGTLTRGMVVGTPAYMAPEQARGEAVTHQTDVYALGAICYRALTGRPAFTGEGVADLVYKVLNTMPPAPSSARPELSDRIDDVLAVAMAKRADHRFETALELAEALEWAVEGHVDERLRARARAAQAVRAWGESPPRD